MTKEGPFELPPELREDMKKARKLEWITAAYLASVIVVMALVMGSSQAMKTAWLEDALSLVPSISFLIATRIYSRAPNKKFPYGYHRVFSIAFLAGSVALFGMGIFLIIDSASSLIKAEHPGIGIQPIGSENIWMGWVMIAALVYSSVPAVILGYKKKPLAKKLHNKIMMTDADGQKADYMTAFAAMIGISLVGLGFWWADSAAAILIALSVVKDGYVNLKTAILDLMDRRPLTAEDNKPSPLLDKIEKEVSTWSWVKDFKLRFREHGQVIFGEISVIANSDDNLSDHIEKGMKTIENLDWKLYDVAIVPVKEFE